MGLFGSSRSGDEEEDDRSWHKVKFDEEKGATENMFGSHRGEKEQDYGGSAPNHGHVVVDLDGEVVYGRDEGER